MRDPVPLSPAESVLADGIAYTNARIIELERDLIILYMSVVGIAVAGIYLLTRTKNR